MARHAGFAVAATVRSALIEQMLAVEISRLNPTRSQFLIPLPDIQPISQNRSVRLSGVLIFDRRPKISLVSNPANVVSVEASVIGYVAAALERNGSVEIEQTWKIRVKARANAAFSVQADPDGVYVYWEGPSSSLLELQVTAEEGAPVPAFLIEALIPISCATRLTPFSRQSRRYAPPRSCIRARCGTSSQQISKTHPFRSPIGS